jgi:hypothetical protein
MSPKDPGAVSLGRVPGCGALNRELGAAVLVSVGTFNLNNLFSRFNYEAEVSELPQEERLRDSSLRPHAALRLSLAFGGKAPQNPQM